ncbi:MAG: lysine--tRNA ligase [Burkholderiales bacterium]|nr:lysine--tRNA ligase [Burkholderiales bacterium]
MLDNQLPDNENHIISERRQKLATIRATQTAYPNSFKPDNNAKNLHSKYDSMNNEELDSHNIMIKIAGRMRLKRIMGKVSFATLQDGASKIQIYLSREKLGEEQYEKFKHLDIGDILGVSGNLFKTKTDELTISVNEITLLSKNLRPLPEKFHGLVDQEQRYRQRYLDLIMNDETKQTFITRSKIIQSIRNTMVEQDYLEVETPMMHSIPGGASAKPFITHHNALSMQLYLRVAPELYLKRLIVGGLDRVFEINRNFRNEGLSTRHNPEFTMLELYESYADYKRMMQLTQQIIRQSALDTIGTLKFIYQNQEINLEDEFDQLTIAEAIIKYNPQYTINQINDLQFLQQELTKLTKNTPVANSSLGVLQLLMFEETTEIKLWQPTFILNYPIDVSPLARESDINRGITERFELFIVGRELANGYSELNDPEEQALRFKKQVEQMEAGNDEAMHYDADYIRALEYGMPHTGGCGIGIDRLVMLLTNSSSIRDVILFPQLRLE